MIISNYTVRLRGDCAIQITVSKGCSMGLGSKDKKGRQNKVTLFLFKSYHLFALIMQTVHLQVEALTIHKAIQISSSSIIE